jgi:glutamine synthetase
MKLSDYIRTNELTAAELARRLGVSRQNVSRWARGDVIPRPDEMKRIIEATAGAVTPNDFFDTAPIAESA